MTKPFIFLLIVTSSSMFLFTMWLFFTKPRSHQLRRYLSSYDPHFAGTEIEEVQQLELSSFASSFYATILGRWTSNLVTKVHGDNTLELAKTLKIKLLTFGLGLSLAILMVIDQGSGATWLIAVAFGFFWIPDLLLKNEYDKKQIALGRYLPDAIDLLNLCGEAGLGFEAAVSKVVSVRHNYITEELGRFIMEMQAGKTRSEALASLISRNTNPEFVRFLSAVRQSERLGIPISNVLHEQATDLRARFRDLAKENAQKVTVKILAPVMLCFLPATFVVVLGPAILGLIEAFS